MTRLKHGGLYYGKTNKRETPILFGKDAERFMREMKRVEGISKERRKAYHEKLRREVEKIEKEWNITYNALREC